jgi:ABC-type glutathione transport system ATPase component
MPGCLKDQIIGLPLSFRQCFGAAYLFITQSPDVVRQFTDWIAVMNCGDIRAVADVATLARSPRCVRAFLNAGQLPSTEFLLLFRRSTNTG